MSKPESSHENIFSYGTIRALHASDTSGPQHELHIHEFVRHDMLPELRSALLGDTEILTTTPNTRMQNLLSPVSRQCLWELHSGIMLRLLENITCTKNLLPDTHCKKSRLLPLQEALATSGGTVNTIDSETGLHVALELLLLLESGDAIIRNLDVPSNTGSVASGETDSDEEYDVLKITYWIRQASDA